MSAPVFLDFFAGFGGSSSGLVEAGFELATAYNHWDRAIQVHAANHSRADHVQGDLSGFDMRWLPKRARFLWASPECTWHSPAGGRARPKRDTALDMFDDHVPSAAGERSRATMWDPIRAAEARKFDVVMIENVPEVAAWPLFSVWLKAWEALGYSWQIVNVSAAHVYGPGNPPAGQWRDRIYVVLARKGIRIPRIEPRPLAWCEQCDDVVEAVQSWKKPHPIQVGKYRRQYDYVCGRNAHARTVVEPFVLPASAVIDWSDLGTRIGDRPRALAAATMRRIEVGLRMFARPAVVAHSGQTWDAAKPGHRQHGELEGYYRVWAADTDPLMTRQAGGSGDGIAVPPHMVAVNHGGGEGRAQLLAGGPLPTRSTKIGDGLVFPPFVAEMYGTSTARSAEHEAMSAVTAGGNHHGLAVPPGAFLSRQYTPKSNDEGRHLNTPVTSPTGPITATGGNHALVVPQSHRPAPYEGALPFELEDVRFRMLGPTEHLRAQRFWEGYDTSAANKSETTKGAGNAVPVNCAHWIGAQVLAAVAA